MCNIWNYATDLIWKEPEKFVSLVTSQIVITVQLLLCKDCQKHSVHLGSTTKFLSDINNHKLHQGAHLHVRLSVEYGERDLFRYYNSLGHHELNDISVQVIDGWHTNKPYKIKRGNGPTGFTQLGHKSDFFLDKNRWERIWAHWISKFVFKQLQLKCVVIV